MNTSLNRSVTNFLSPVQQQSLAVLAIVNEGPVQAFIITGLLGFLSSVSIVTTIAFTKKLHTKNYVLVACLAISDTLMACTLVSIGVRRIWYFRSLTPMVVSRLRCLFEDSLRAFSASCINGFFCTCALDRFLALATPKWYSMVYPKWLFVLLIVINYLRASIEVGVLFWGINQQELISMCSYALAADLDVQYAQNIRNKTLLALICVLFLATIAIVIYRLRKMKRLGENIREKRKQMQIKIVKTLGMMLVCYFVSVILNSIIFMFVYDAPAAVQVKYGAFIFTFQEASAVCNFTILLTQNSDFRTGYTNLLKGNVAKRRTKQSTLNIGPSTTFKRNSIVYKKENATNINLATAKTILVSEKLNKVKF